MFSTLSYSPSMGLLYDHVLISGSSCCSPSCQIIFCPRAWCCGFFSCIVSLLPESPVFCLLSVSSMAAVWASQVIISAQADGSLVELIHCGPHVLTWLVAVLLENACGQGLGPSSPCYVLSSPTPLQLPKLCGYFLLSSSLHECWTFF